MSTDVRTDLDFNGNQILNVAVHNVAQLPVSGVTNQIIGADNLMYFWNGSSWLNTCVQIATDAEAATGTSETVAINPKQHALKADLASPVFTGTPTAPTAATGTSTTQLATTEFVAQEISVAVANAVVYKGTWDTTGATDYSALNNYRPIKAGWMFRVVGTGCTIDSVEYRDGDSIVFNNAIPAGAPITTMSIDKIDNTESDDIVRLNSTQTLTNKTIDADDNSIVDLTTSNFKSGEIVTSVTQNSGKLITSGGVYTALGDYEKTITFSTGLTDTVAGDGTHTVTIDYPFIALAAGSIAYGGSGGVLTELTKGTDGQVLTLSGGLPVWSNSQSMIKKETFTNPSLTPSSGVCTWTIAHTLGTTDFTARVYDVSTGKNVIMNILATGTTSATVQFKATGNVSAGTYKLVLIG